MTRSIMRVRPSSYRDCTAISRLAQGRHGRLMRPSWKTFVFQAAWAKGSSSSMVHRMALLLDASSGTRLVRGVEKAEACRRLCWSRIRTDPFRPAAGTASACGPTPDLDRTRMHEQ